MNLCILPLEHGSPIIKGEYGLDPCSARGIVRISHKQRLSLSRAPLLINSISVILKGQRVVKIWDSLTCSLSFKCEESFLELKEYLLHEPETIPYGRVLELPFEILLPKPQAADKNPGSVKYLPPSFYVGGMSSVGYGHHYECTVKYLLNAELVGEVGNSESLINASAPLSSEALDVPLLVFNPTNIVALMWPETRRWRSLPGMAVLEYDIELGSIAMGPGDPLKLVYRMRLTKHAIKKNIRIKKVHFMLKETHTIGECFTDDRDNPEHCRIRIKNTVTLINFPLKASDFKPSKLRAIRRNHDDITEHQIALESSNQSKCFSSGQEGFWDNGTGLFSENILYIPPRGKIIPSTSDCYLNSTGRKHGVTLHMDISHSLQVTVEFSGADSITMCGSCVIYPIGKVDYAHLFDTNPGILPTPDYEKVVGCECWVPDYADPDEALDPTSVKLSSDALAAIEAIYGASDDPSV